MNIEKSKGPELLPKELPPFRYLQYPVVAPPAAGLPPPTVPLEEELPFELLRVIFWTFAVATAFRAEELWRAIPGYKFAAYGFADPESEADAFAVLVYASPSVVEDSDRRHVVKVGEHTFPVFIRRWIEILHGAPTIHPQRGTAACWATSARLQHPSNFGLLTAKHVLGAQPQLAARVPTTAGTATIIDLAPDGVDAALIAPAGVTQPRSGSLLTPVVHITPWTDVIFDGAQSGRIQTKVVAVTDTRGSLDPSIPARIFLAKPGQSGDSGALVSDLSGDGVGIYLGEVKDQAGRAEGFAQHLGQVTHAMQLTLYS
jgi:hypothetical protein